MDVPSGSLRHWLAAVWASAVLCLPKVEQASFSLEAILHDQAEPFLEVGPQVWVERIGFTFDLDVASDWRVTSSHQLHKPCLAVISFDLCAEHPIACSNMEEVTFLNPRFRLCLLYTSPSPRDS